MRYDRQEKVIGKRELLANKKVAIIGVGSTGGLVAELLVRAGVGEIYVYDHDSVEITNLNRQVLFNEEDLGKSKATVAAAALKKMNSDVKIVGENLHINYETINQVNADLIIECTDNLRARFIINDYSLKTKTPWIYTAAVEDRGSIFVTVPEGVCFACIFADSKEIDSCSTVGILSSAATTAASLAVTEVLKILTGKEPCLDLMHFNSLEQEFRKLKVNKRKGCKSCKGDYEFLEKPTTKFKIGHCQTHNVLSSKPMQTMKIDLDSFDTMKKTDTSAEVVIDGVKVIVQDFGKLLFPDETDEEKAKLIAEKIYSKAL